MTRAIQKQRELTAVKSLRDLLADFPRQAEIEASEEPLDVLLTLPDGRRIGVEVTDFVRDRSPQGSALDQYQDLTRKIAKAAEEAYARLGGRNLFTMLHFARPLTCSKRQIPAVGERIARRVSEAAATLTETTQLEGDGLRPEVEKIVIQPLELPSPQFAPVYTDAWEYVSSAHLEQIVNEKEPNVPAYRAKCDELWLLMYIEGMRMSGWVEPPADLSLTVRATSFDRMFLLYDASRLFEVSRQE